ncbi:MFS transporter [Salininema proteolyticum]|uniref:MFS transporter n=1 Tax=Salininema proteolyticum TaxID=1607685 RepID=A0ABV8TX23_9ACTN
MPLALFALMVSAFGIGTTEFVVSGLLPEIGDDMNVSLSMAGLLISGYALGVVVGGPIATAAGTRLPRKNMLIILMLLFIAGNVLAALAPTYGFLMAGRIISAVCHGAFFGIAAVVAADLVDDSKRSRAISMVFTGLTIANVVGSPLGTWVGQGFGWRATFIMITIIGFISLVGIAALIPKQPRPESTSLRAELSEFKKLQVWLAVAIAGLSIGALFAAYSYIAPILTDVSGFDSSSLTLLLVLFGVGLVIGNLLGGRFADRAQIPTLLVTTALLAVVLVVFTFTAHYKIPAAFTLMLVGGAGFATVPGFMTRAIDKAKGAPTLASAVASSGANLGISIGAYVGGLTIDVELGLTSPIWVGVVMAALALAVTAWAGALDKSERKQSDEPIAKADTPAAVQS